MSTALSVTRTSGTLTTPARRSASMWKAATPGTASTGTGPATAFMCSRRPSICSLLTLYPKSWQQHSYVALCGVGEQAILWMLEQNPEIRRPILCLDHDAAGIEAAGRLKEILAERGYAETAVLQSVHKDWNEDVKARCGLEAQSAEEHPNSWRRRRYANGSAP